MSLCWHNTLLPIRFAGKVVAQLCGDCLVRLDPEFGCPECTYATVRRRGTPQMGRALVRRCQAHGGPVQAY